MLNTDLFLVAAGEYSRPFWFFGVTLKIFFVSDDAKCTGQILLVII